MIDKFEWERSLPNSEMMGMKSRRGVIKEPMGVIGSIVPWNYPLEVTLNKLGPDSCYRQHDDHQAGAGHALERHPARPAHR